MQKNQPPFFKAVDFLTESKMYCHLYMYKFPQLFLSLHSALYVPSHPDNTPPPFPVLYIYALPPVTVL